MCHFLRDGLYPLLLRFGVKFSTSLLEDMEQCLEGCNVSSVGSLKFKQVFTLNTIKSLDQTIKEFLQPLEENIDFFVFFSLLRSILFSEHLKHHLSVFEDISIEDLNTGLIATKKTLQSFVNGDIKYKDLTLNGVVSLKNVENIDKEFEIFKAGLACNHLRKDTGKGGYEDLKCLFKLFEIAKKVQIMHDVLETLELGAISAHPEFVECFKLASQFKDTRQDIDIKLCDAKDTLKDIQAKLYLSNSEECKCLEMLLPIKDSRELFNFIVARKFYGDSDAFRNRFQFITTQLQSMDYDENVLNNLPAAVRLLSPFCSLKATSSSNPFKDFMESLKENSKYGTRKLAIVNEHMSIIQKWFSNTNVRV